MKILNTIRLQFIEADLEDLLKDFERPEFEDSYNADSRIIFRRWLSDIRGVIADEMVAK